MGVYRYFCNFFGMGDFELIKLPNVPRAPHPQSINPINLNQEEQAAIDDPNNSVSTQTNDPLTTVSGIQIANLHSPGIKHLGNSAVARLYEAGLHHNTPVVCLFDRPQTYTSFWQHPDDNAVYQSSNIRQVDFEEVATIYFLKSTREAMSAHTTPHLNICKNNIGCFVQTNSCPIALQSNQSYRLQSQDSDRIMLSGPGVPVDTPICTCPGDFDLEFSINDQGQLLVCNQSADPPLVRMKSDSHYSSQYRKHITTIDRNLEHLKKGDMLEVEFNNGSSMSFVVTREINQADSCRLIETTTLHRTANIVLDFESAQELREKLSELDPKEFRIYKAFRASDLQEGDIAETASGHQILIGQIREHDKHRFIQIQIKRPGEHNTKHIMQDSLILHRNSRIQDIASIVRH